VKSSVASGKPSRKSIIGDFLSPAPRRVRGTSAKKNSGNDSTASATRQETVVAYLPVPKWKELHIIAVLNEMSIDALVHHGVDLVIEEYKKKRSAI
jgi:hypothetical protein